MRDTQYLILGERGNMANSPLGNLHLFDAKSWNMDREHSLREERSSGFAGGSSAGMTEGSFGVDYKICWWITKYVGEMTVGRPWIDGGKNITAKFHLDNYCECRVASYEDHPQNQPPIRRVTTFSKTHYHLYVEGMVSTNHCEPCPKPVCPCVGEDPPVRKTSQNYLSPLLDYNPNMKESWLDDQVADANDVKCPCGPTGPPDIDPT